MPIRSRSAAPRRYKAYEQTHQQLIQAAVRLIGDRGLEAISLAALAREAGVNRTTVYYHFDDREAVLADVKLWSSQQIVRAFQPDLPQTERIDYVTRFVLENPEVMKLWIEEFISPGNIRDSYPHWDALVDGVRTHLAAAFPAQEVDAEVYCVELLASALIGPRILRNRVCPDAATEDIVARFRKEHQRTLRQGALLRP
ncbi:TetR/AcrR family transcriptional regulator [Sphingomonas sp. RT2P30]|uniref:TetR/AcrR family transcriptional regulator n=1 Tax=Parasphingomonas halimpatiens TaxID=3096162 RepID=UPI002FCAA9AD